MIARIRVGIFIHLEANIKCTHSALLKSESKQVNSFIDKLIEFTSESETPTSFWWWGGAAIVAAVLRDNVYWTQRGHKICPNIYVLLNADSAVHRKSGPVKEADRLLALVKNTKVIRGRGSIQAILEDLANSVMDRETGKTLRGGSCLLVADELKSFFIEDGALVGILTDVYEYKDQFDYKLRGAPFKVKGLCISMLAASNDEFLKSIYTGEAVYGGLLGRTFLVRNNGEYRPGNSLLETPEEEEINRVKYDPKPLVDQLLSMSKLIGKVKFELDAKLEYDKWYMPLRESYRLKPDKAGVIQRIHTGVIKIAVILAVASRLSLVVNKRDIQEAIEKCVELLPNYETFAMQIGKSTEAMSGSILLDAMWANGGSITRSAFLAEHWGDVSNEVLDKVINTLENAQYIGRSFNGTGSDMFVMTPKCKEIFERKI